MLCAERLELTVRTTVWSLESDQHPPFFFVWVCVYVCSNQFRLNWFQKIFIRFKHRCWAWNAQFQRVWSSKSCNIHYTYTYVQYYTIIFRLVFFLHPKIKCAMIFSMSQSACQWIQFGHCVFDEYFFVLFHTHKKNTKIIHWKCYVVPICLHFCSITWYAFIFFLLATINDYMAEIAVNKNVAENESERTLARKRQKLP